MPFFGKAERDDRVNTPQELRRTFESLSEVRNEVKQLQTDNLGLYEKVRYLQAYSSTSGAGQSGHVTPAIASLQRRDEPTDKYKARYEANVASAANPFQAFRGRVSLDAGDLPRLLRSCA